MKIVATADVHLGMKFSGYPVLQAELAEARFAALEAVVSLANDREADLIVVAGDLFHRVRVAAAVVERAAAILDRFTGAATLVLPGNHDYIAPEGDRLWASFASACGDRTLVLASPQAYDLAHYDLPLMVLAAPCDSQHSTTHRLAWLEQPDARDSIAAHSGTVLGVAHGSIDGLTLDSEGRYFPMTRDQLRGLPGSVWIVGHTHRFTWEAGDGVLVPGTPEPDGFDVPTPGTAALIELDGPSGASVSPVETGTHRFTRVDLSLDQLTLDSPQTIATEAVARISEPGTVARLHVSGRLGPDEWRNWNAARERILADERVVRLDDHAVERRLTPEQVDSEYDQGGFAHALLSDLVADDDHEAVSLALDIMAEADS